MIVGWRGIRLEHGGNALYLWETIAELITEIEPIGQELFDTVFRNTEFTFSIASEDWYTTSGEGKANEHRRVRGLGQSWSSEAEIPSITQDLMHHFKVIRLQLPAPVGIASSGVRMEGLEINVVEDAAWFIDTLNRLENLWKVIIILTVKPAAKMQMSEEETQARVFELYSPLKNLRKMEVVFEFEKFRPYYSWCGVGRL
jgi:hypothetical protein